VDPRLALALPDSLRRLPLGWAIDVDADDEPYFVDHNTQATARCPEWLTDEQRRDLLRIHGYVSGSEDDSRLTTASVNATPRPATAAGNVFSARAGSRTALSLVLEEGNNSSIAGADDDVHASSVLEDLRHVIRPPHAAVVASSPGPPTLLPLSSTSLGASPARHTELNNPPSPTDPTDAGKAGKNFTHISSAHNLPTYHEHCAAQLADTNLTPRGLAPASSDTSNSPFSSPSRDSDGHTSEELHPSSPFVCPAGWQRYVDDGSGEPYYVHEGRQRVSWTHPGLCLAIYNIRLEELPPAWDVGIDVRGLYFVNHATQHTQRRVPCALSSLASEISSAIAMSITDDSERRHSTGSASLSPSLSDALDTLSLGASSVASAVSGVFRSLGNRLWPQSPDLPRYHDARSLRDPATKARSPVVWDGDEQWRDCADGISPATVLHAFANTDAEEATAARSGDALFTVTV
jgi:hypothetical protein